MALKLADLFAPEETVGEWWDRLIRRPTDLPHYEEAAVTFDAAAPRLGVFFRALGGDHGIELKAATDITTAARTGWLRALGHAAFVVPRARIDGDTLLLPAHLDVFPDARLNADLYYWLTAFAAALNGEYPALPADPLRADVATLIFARRMAARALMIAPGLRRRYERLCAAALRQRPERELPPAEEMVEEAVRALLANPLDDPPADPANPVLAAILDGQAEHAPRAPRNYRPMLPAPLWADALPRPLREETEERATEPAAGDVPEQEERKAHRAKRHKKAAQKKDPLILNRFEHILALSEFFNLNRLVDDDTDEEEAKKARDDLDEISLVNVDKAPKTKLAFDLDLAPEEVERARLADRFVYPEWDYRRRTYLPDHCRVLEQTGEELPDAPWRPDEASLRRIRAVRRRFEALRPKREVLRRQLDGPELDTDALVRAISDLAACGEGSERIWLNTRRQARDLAVAVLFDTSRSTETWVENRQVIDIAREALTAFAEGLAAVGDDYAIYAFSSVRRDKVFMNALKRFDERHGPKVRRRIAALKPGFYTRMGAAIRHLSKLLNERPNGRRLLLVITDGKPNDLDHYEGRYGVEDTRRAVIEARRAGLSVFGVTIDDKARDYFPRIFGRNAYAIISHPARLTRALPKLYRHLVT